MSQKKEILIKKTINEITFDLLKGLVLLDADASKDFFKEIGEIEVENSKDPEKIIELLPESLKAKYKGILASIKIPIEIGIRKYDQWLIMI